MSSSDVTPPSSLASTSSTPSTSTSNPSSTPTPTTSQKPIPIFSSSLETALNEVCPSTDQFDQSSFNAIDYINNIFPDESSLTSGTLESQLTSLNKKLHHTEESLVREVREQNNTKIATTYAINSAQNNIKQLFEKISAIKQKATQSEVMVQEICRDIRSLDAAKKHLTDTIRALRNLNMLVSAMDQLEASIAAGTHRETAKLLKAITDLFTLFLPSHENVPKIKQLHQSLIQAKAKIKENVTSQYHRIIQR